MTTIVAISDTHGLHRQIPVPDGDVLVHAGDLTNVGELDQVQDFNDWLGELPHENKVVIAGNHDFCFQDAGTPHRFKSRDKQQVQAEAMLTNCHYLRDSGVALAGLNFWGSPWQPWFGSWAFNAQRGREIQAKWGLIPESTDVLVTHGPPINILDSTSRGDSAGCQDLWHAIVNMVKPGLHIFGHIHEAYGTHVDEATTYINASCCTLAYQPTNAPIIHVCPTK